MNELRITFRCELLDDMHSGSGLGWLGQIDDRQARDANGRPVVWASTLIGLLRDVADDLTDLGHDLAMEARVRQLFGAEGTDTRSALIARSLHFDRKKGEEDLPQFLTTTSTAREVYSRRALDDTLRTIEFAAAGLTAEGEIRLLGDEDDQKLLELCLRRLPSLGGGKTRGAGQVQLTALVATPAPTVQPPPAPPAKPCRLRLLLRNLEPLCMAATGHPGNIITTESYLPGQALRGAFLRGLTTRGVAVEEVDELAKPDRVQFGNGYLVPAEIKNLRHLTSIPLPLTAEESKPTERKSDAAEGPWWSLPRATAEAWLPDPKKDCWDRLLPEARTRDGDPPENDQAKFKRIKREDYLVAIGPGPLTVVRPALATLMRNRTPVARVGRNKDSRRPNASAADLKKEQGDLFTQAVLVEDQFFVADIRFESHEAAKLFSERAASFLGNPVTARSWLRVGRGGRPVRVENCLWIEDDAPQSLSPDDSFTLTLTSDLIARASDLTFRTTLDEETLASLAGVPLLAGQFTVNRKVRVSETRIVHGFNTAAGSRRTPAVAIKRGSAFLIQSTDYNTLQQLFTKLANREARGQGIGERQEDGFGRFALNHAAHRPPAQVEVGGQGLEKKQDPRPLRRSSDDESRRRSEREAAIGNVLKAVADVDLEELCKDKAFPSRSQWQRLRHEIEVRQQEAELSALFTELRSRSTTLSGKMWACQLKNGKSLIVELDERRQRVGGVAAQRIFLIYLARWVVVQLDRIRREQKG